MRTVRTAREARGGVSLPSPSNWGSSAPAAVSVVSSDPLESLRGALAARDADALGRAGDDLAAWVGGDEGRALGLVDGLRAETDAVATDLLAMTLASDPAAATWSVVAREMLAIARADPLAERRRAALLYLSRSGARSAEIEADATWIARSDADLLARAAAFELLGSIASSDPFAASRLHPVMVAEAAHAADPSVRIAALQAVDPGLASEEVLRAMGGVACTDADPCVRLEAVARLREASTAKRPLVVELLREAANRATDDEVRGACSEAVADQTEGR